MAGSFVRIDPAQAELRKFAAENFKDAALRAAFLSKWKSFDGFDMQSFMRRFYLTMSDTPSVVEGEDLFTMTFKFEVAGMERTVCMRVIIARGLVAEIVPEKMLSLTPPEK